MSSQLLHQQHSLNPRQMTLKSRLIALLQQRLPALKNTYCNKDFTQIIVDINKVLCTIDTATIEETNQLYSTAVVLTGELGYKVQSNSTSTQDTPPNKCKVRLQRKIDKWRVDKRRHQQTTKRSVVDATYSITGNQSNN